MFIVGYFFIRLFLEDAFYFKTLLPQLHLAIFLIISLCYFSILLFLFLNKEDKPNHLSRHRTQIKDTTTQFKKITRSAISQFLERPTWKIGIIQNLNEQQFKQLCIAYYQVKGIKYSLFTMGINNSLDILIWKNEVISKVIHCSTLPIIDLVEIRHFLGVMVHERATEGLILHRGNVSEAASLFANSHRIQLRSEFALLTQIELLSEKKQRRLWALLRRIKGTELNPESAKT
ncbi:restriction endonuclease [Deefgea piscis]|uniref:restriction endonuclease n=1 Tax=Deefgea piscis TaxID=2739061 RepID=UPI001C7F1F29|nr:restriction endonuclease [Deefgea piscis]QZA82164.1 restriction endonuclease [Deefgea piscis]